MRTALRSLTLLAVVALAAAALAACGSSSTGSSGSKRSGTTFDIDMKNTKFVPASVSVPAGKLITFRFHNHDDIDHEAFLGTAAQQDAHDHEMAAGAMGDSSSTTMMGDTSTMMGDSSTTMGMTDANEVSVPAGKDGTLTHTFMMGDKLLIGCHVKDHYMKGMKLTITVTG